jgi:hypothetical protein
MQHRKRYRKTEENKQFRPVPAQVMKEKIFDTRKGLKKFLKRKFG